MKMPKTFIRRTNRTFKPTENPNPSYKVERCVTTRKYIFDVINTTTGEVINNSVLYWMHDTNDDANIPAMYHGCSYRFANYNPTPVTDWFHGVPISQMIEWCDRHGLVNCRCVSEFKNITYADECTWDSCNMKWVKPESRRRSR